MMAQGSWFDGPADLTRRSFLRRAGGGTLAAMVASALGSAAAGGSPRGPTPRAKRVIFLFQSGGPSQLDLFDHKPALQRLSGQPMPESLTRGQRVAQLRDRKLVIVGSAFAFRRHGESGAEISELLPYTAAIADRIAIVRSVQTEAINHDPGITMMQTGFQLPGRPSMGSWVSYALPAVNRSLPAFIVLISGAAAGAQPLFARLWSAAFLPGPHQGVRLRPGAEPVLFLSNPGGVDRALRRQMVDHVARLNRLEDEEVGDPAIQTRTQAYDMALRMQESVPELMDLSLEPQHILDLYGVKPGESSFAMNCLLARRLVERDVRFVQLYHAEVPRDRSRLRSVGRRPRPARTARGHAGHLGRRVRPDSDEPGGHDRGQLWPRPPRQGLHHVARRRRHPARRHHRRDRRAGL
jgi:hypothetical protein